MEHPLLRFRLAVTLLAIVIAVGVTGYMLINGWTLLDSFYMVIITISTVGYTEVHPQGHAGRLFTSGLIVVGVATMLYGFGVFAETLADNTFGRYRRERQLQRELNQLRDHFIICGYGRIGTQIVAEFEDHKVAYVVIDQTEEALERVRSERRLHIEGEAVPFATPPRKRSSSKPGSSARADSSPPSTPTSVRCTSSSPREPSTRTSTSSPAPAGQIRSAASSSQARHAPSRPT